MTVTIKGWKGDELVFEQTLDAGREDLSEIATQHALMTADGTIDMVEIIFPDGDHARFGTNPGRMVMPFQIDFD